MSELVSKQRATLHRPFAPTLSTSSRIYSHVPSLRHTCAPPSSPIRQGSGMSSSGRGPCPGLRHPCVQLNTTQTHAIPFQLPVPPPHSLPTSVSAVLLQYHYPLAMVACLLACFFSLSHHLWARSERHFNRKAAATCYTWAGALLAISGLEAWVKFQAPLVTQKIGLDVGRHVFSALNKLEIFWAVVLLYFNIKLWRSLSWDVNKPLHYIFVLLTPAAIVVAETVWLLPALSSRAAMFIWGTPPPASNIHWWAIGFAVVKFLFLQNLGQFSQECE